MAFPVVISASATPPVYDSGQHNYGAFKASNGNLFVFVLNATPAVVAFKSTDGGNTWALSATGPTVRTGADVGAGLFTNFNAIQKGDNIYVIYGKAGGAPVFTLQIFGLVTETFGAAIDSTLGYSASGGGTTVGQAAIAVFRASDSKILLIGGATSINDGGVNRPFPNFATFDTVGLIWSGWTNIAAGGLNINTLSAQFAAVDGSNNTHILLGGQYLPVGFTQIVVHSNNSFSAPANLPAGAQAFSFGIVCSATTVYFPYSDFTDVFVLSAGIGDAPVWSSETAIGGGLGWQAAIGSCIDGTSLVVAGVSGGDLKSASRPVAGGSWTVTDQGVSVSVAGLINMASGSTFIVLFTTGGTGTDFWFFGSGGGSSAPVNMGPTGMSLLGPAGGGVAIILPDPRATHMCRYSQIVPCEAPQGHLRYVLGKDITIWEHQSIHSETE